MAITSIEFKTESVSPIFNLGSFHQQTPASIEGQLLQLFRELILERVLEPLASCALSDFQARFAQAVVDYIPLRNSVISFMVGSIYKDKSSENKGLAELTESEASELKRGIEHQQKLREFLEPKQAEILLMVLDMQTNATILLFELVESGSIDSASPVMKGWGQSVLLTELCVMAILAHGFQRISLDQRKVNHLLKQAHTSSGEMQKEIRRLHRHSINHLPASLPDVASLLRKVGEIPEERRCGGDPVEASEAEDELFHSLAPARKEANKHLDKDEHVN